jgi:DNA-binding transcriptional MerR regulator
MSAHYKIHEFAELSGVTVKALHHYDRLGLLKPTRTDAGYRIYADRDLERLEQIVALKFIGLSLQQIRVVLDRAATELPETLRLQRQVLEEKQRLLARAINAILDAEKTIRPGEPTDPAVLKRLIEVIAMQDKWDFMKRYWGDGTWAEAEAAVEKIKSGPAEELKELRREIEAALGEDPAGEKAQALGERYAAFMKRNSSLFSFLMDPEFLAGGKKLVADRKNWPAGVESHLEQTNASQVVPFILKIMAARDEKKKQTGFGRRS